MGSILAISNQKGCKALFLYPISSKMNSIWLAAALWACSLQLMAQYHVDKLNQLIASEKESKGLRHANWGVAVVSCKTGKTVLQYQAEKLMMPASTLKLITTAAALEYLGKDFAFKTTLLLNGKIINGVLQGDLVVVGGGDPSLGSKYLTHTTPENTLELWVKKLKEKGIKSIAGNLVCDASHFDANPYPAGWQWNDIGNYYGAPIYGLNYYDNLYYIDFKIQNHKANITAVRPADLGLKFKNEAAVKGHTDLAYIYGAPGSPHRLITGTLPENKTNFSIKGSLPDPAWLLGKSLSEKMKSSGIELKGKVISSIEAFDFEPYMYAQADTLLVHMSPPLSQLIQSTNTHSLNLYAECLHRQLGKQVKGKATTDAGNEVLNTYLERLRLPENSFFVVDGSGVSPGNAITPMSMANVLKSVKSKPYFNDFVQSLPVAGRTGTLSGMCKGSRAEGNLRAKSGTLTRVICYAGYVTSKSGEELAFSIMFNNYGYSFSQMKQLAEKMLILLAEI